MDLTTYCTTFYFTNLEGPMAKKSQKIALAAEAEEPAKESVAEVVEETPAASDGDAATEVPEQKSEEPAPEKEPEEVVPPAVEEPIPEPPAAEETPAAPAEGERFFECVVSTGSGYRVNALRRRRRG
jgi:hypothetical protein